MGVWRFPLKRDLMRCLLEPSLFKVGPSFLTTQGWDKGKEEAVATAGFHVPWRQMPKWLWYTHFPSFEHRK